MLNWLLMVGTDGQPELTIRNFDYQNLALTLGIIVFVLIVVIFIGGIAGYCYIENLKDKISKLENPDKKEQ